MAVKLAGKPYAAGILAECAERIAALREGGRGVGLAIVRVGDDPASTVYIGRKIAACESLGIDAVVEALPAGSGTGRVLEAVAELNLNPRVSGIIVQQPLPPEVDTLAVVSAVSTAKDVDGLHPANFGLLANGSAASPRPCTPQGCMHLLERAGIEVRGRRAAVIGRSMIVGRPLALMLEQEGATVTLCHSATADLGAACRDADILASAVGSPGLVTAGMVKPGAAVLDIGISRGADGRLRGDVSAEAAAKASHITPVPGGVGPLTVAMLMRNTVAAAGGDFG